MFHGCNILSYQQILVFYNHLSSVHCYVSSNFIYFCLFRSLSSKWKPSPESILPLSWTKERTWEGLNTDFQPIVLLSFLHPTLASINTLNPQLLGLALFSSMNCLWLDGFLPYKHVWFWVLYCEINFQSFFRFLSSISFDVFVCFHFLWCVFVPVVYILFYLFIFLLYSHLMEFQEEMG